MATKSVEEIKQESRQLRGGIADTLADASATHFEESDYQLLKFHGTYQQDDRDVRSERKRAGLDKAWSFMVRTKQPGGNMTAAQYLAMDVLADEIANGTLRITTRQGLQFHGILKTDLRDAMRRISASGMTTWGACGDVVRNTMGPAAPLCDAAHEDAQNLARELSDRFLAKSTAYTQIWLNGEKLELNVDGEVVEPVEEPIYGSHYLPRKFKIGIVVPPRNDVDVFSQDIGFITHVEGGRVAGYSVVAGGGFGMSHGQSATYPVLAKPLFYVAREHAVDAAVAIVTVQRDYGDRSDRKHSRLKYTIEDRGIDWFRDEVVKRMNGTVEPFREFRFNTVGDMLGWHEQGNGKLFCCVHVEVGRIKDEADGRRYRSGFRALAERFGKPMRFTPNTNALFYDIEPKEKSAFEATLCEFGIPSDHSLTEARKSAHACVALPTCGLSLAESERFFPSLMDQIDRDLYELGLEREPILFRMTGCPNGCARPYNADFGFVGRAPGRYALFVGGSIAGDRLAGLEQKVATAEQLPGIVRSYLEDFVANRREGETFSAYWGRTHTNGAAPHPDQFHIELTERASRLEAAKKKQ